MLVCTVHSWPPPVVFVGYSCLCMNFHLTCLTHITRFHALVWLSLFLFHSFPCLDPFCFSALHHSVCSAHHLPCRWRIKWSLSRVKVFTGLQSFSSWRCLAGFWQAGATPYATLWQGQDWAGLVWPQWEALVWLGPGGCGPFLSSVQWKKSHQGNLYVIMIHWMAWYICNYWEWLAERRHIISDVTATGN